MHMYTHVHDPHLVETEVDTVDCLVWREEDDGAEEVGEGGDDLETLGFFLDLLKRLGHSHVWDPAGMGMENKLYSCIKGTFRRLSICA